MNEQVMDAVAPYLLRVKKSGGPNIQAICPFHEDEHRSTPSFSVNTDNGLWQCFGCGEAGDVIRVNLESQTAGLSVSYRYVV